MCGFVSVQVARGVLFDVDALPDPLLDTRDVKHAETAVTRPDLTQTQAKLELLMETVKVGEKFGLLSLEADGVPGISD